MFDHIWNKLSKIDPSKNTVEKLSMHMKSRKISNHLYISFHSNIKFPCLEIFWHIKNSTSLSNEKNKSLVTTLVSKLTPLIQKSFSF